jgi:hypothetical protein
MRQPRNPNPDGTCAGAKVYYETPQSIDNILWERRLIKSTSLPESKDE